LHGAIPKNSPFISHEDSIFGTDDDDCELPDEVPPFLKDQRLEDDRTADGISHA
jgi:pre-mRNA-processing factor 8